MSTAAKNGTRLLRQHFYSIAPSRTIFRRKGTSAEVHFSLQIERWRIEMAGSSDDDRSKKSISSDASHKLIASAPD